MKVVSQAVFKDSRETLIRIGTMRFVDYLVTERPTPPAADLSATNHTHSLAFRFGINDTLQSSREEISSSIFPLLSHKIDSRSTDGHLSAFQSTPAGEPENITLLQSQRVALAALITRLMQVMPLVKSRCSSCCLILKRNRGQPLVHSESVFVQLYATIVTTFQSAAVPIVLCTRCCSLASQGRNFARWTGACGSAGVARRGCCCGS
jgi:hypothetical protein